MKLNLFIDFMDYLQTFKSMGCYFFWHINEDSITLYFESSRRKNFDRKFVYELKEEIDLVDLLDFLDKVQSEMQIHLRRFE